jgi:hypothetical protein
MYNPSMTKSLRQAAEVFGFSPHGAKYFGSYKYIHPDRKTHLAAGGTNEEMDTQIMRDGRYRYVRVTAENYPKLHAAVMAESEFRGIEPPAAYIDRRPLGGGGDADQKLYAISVEEPLHNLLSPGELRAIVAHEIKHLFQECTGGYEDIRTVRENEIDANFAALQSTGRKTMLSLCRKLIDYGVTFNAAFKQASVWDTPEFSTQTSIACTMRTLRRMQRFFETERNLS